ncbi:hypothetical protein D9611_012961 [Ephemerocybe angulata]|uniref:NAD(P)-binding protein n=1 Tax=Ephemerocybe angulata TaxID=980116 RepID=A0A8H5C404_9AGAR|nr:hypothetical protein D9611_012961 [Tulosesus angulatus]
MAYGRLTAHGRWLAEELARTRLPPSLKLRQRKSIDGGDETVDMREKVVIVTGGKGHGLAVVRELLRLGTKRVYMASRNERRAQEAIAGLHEEGLGNTVDSEVLWLKLHLGDPREAKRAAEEFMGKEGRLDVLINNAGDMLATGLGRDGVSNMHIVKQVNPATHGHYYEPADLQLTLTSHSYISPYIFTQTLLPLLKKTAQDPSSDVRIINVISKAYTFVTSDIEYSRIEDFNIRYTFCPHTDLHQYASANLAKLLWSRHLYAHLISSNPPLPGGITVLSIHPGSTLDKFTPGIPKAIASLYTVTPEMSVRTTIFAAASRCVWNERERYQARGGLVCLVDVPVPGSVQEVSGMARDEGLGRDLIRTTEYFLSSIGL